MTNEELKAKTLEIAALLFASEELYLSRGELKNHLQGESAGYIDLIRESLCSINKITKKRGQTGGIQFADVKYQRSKLTHSEKILIEKKVDHLFKEYNEQSARPRNEKPEKEVELAFKNWLENQEKYFTDSVFIRFRSDARKAKKGQNVDGYALKVETLKYHFSFRPILTTFEVKANLPNILDVNQAKNYLKFSHEVYLVFKFDGNAEALKNALNKIEYNYSKDGIGIFFSQDSVNFECLYEAHRGNPSEDQVDEKIEVLLSEIDRETLLSRKFKYIIEEVFTPLIS